MSDATSVVAWLNANGFTREATRVTDVLAAEAALAPPPKPELEPEPPKELAKPAVKATKPAAKTTAKKAKAK